MPKNNDLTEAVPATSIPATELERGYNALIRRYDSDRNALLRTCYAWLNLTLLLSLSWPALVVYFEAPVVSVAHTPRDWFLLRLAAPVVTLAAAARMWRASGAPGYVAHPARLAAVRALGPVWLQALAFMLLLSITLSVVLVLSAPAAALKVLLFGLAEAAAVQYIIPGYVKSSLETLGGRAIRLFWISATLFGIVFALRGGLAAAIQPDASAGLIAAASSGGFLGGLVLGMLCTYLRDRTASLFPGIALHFLVVALIPAVVS